MSETFTFTDTSHDGPRFSIYNQDGVARAHITKMSALHGVGYCIDEPGWMIVFRNRVGRGQPLLGLPSIVAGTPSASHYVTGATTVQRVIDFAIAALGDLISPDEHEALIPPNWSAQVGLHPAITSLI